LGWNRQPRLALPGVAAPRAKRHLTLRVTSWRCASHPDAGRHNLPLGVTIRRPARERRSAREPLAHAAEIGTRAG